MLPRRLLMPADTPHQGPPPENEEAPAATGALLENTGNTNNANYIKCHLAAPANDAEPWRDLWHDGELAYLLMWAERHRIPFDAAFHGAERIINSGATRWILVGYLPFDTDA